MALVLIVNAIVVVVLVACVVVLHRRVVALEAEPTVDVETRETPAAHRRADVIVVEITNHTEVASRRTLLARPVAAVSPGLIRSIVHREAVTVMRRQLADEGVEADVRLRRARLPIPAEAPPEPSVAPPTVVDEFDDWLHADGANPLDDT